MRRRKVGGKTEGLEGSPEFDEALRWETWKSGWEGGSARLAACRGDEGSHFGCSRKGCCGCSAFEVEQFFVAVRLTLQTKISFGFLEQALQVLLTLIYRSS